MTKYLRYVWMAAIVAAMAIIAGRHFPNYALRISFFSAFLFIDALYWPAFRKTLSPGKALAARCLLIYYWLPFVLLVATALAAVFIPVQKWFPFFRIYIPGFIVVLYIGKILLLIILMLSDLLTAPYNLIVWFRSSGNKAGYEWKRFKAVAYTGLAVSFTVILIFMAGMVHWVYDFKVQNVMVEMDELPASFNGFKIIQISDVHLGGWRTKERLREAVSIIRQLKPDMVVFTGDMVNFSSEEALPFTKELRRLKAPSGVYAIKGNHDYGDYLSWDTPSGKDKNVRDLDAFYKNIGWQLLNNAHRLLIRGNDTIVLVGVENWSASRLWGKRGNLKKALSGAEHPGFKILLSHDPTHWDNEVSGLYPDIDLTLSGHTHAMQMGWEGRNSQWSPAQWKYNEWAGLYEHDFPVKQFLYVNPGLGHILYPGRIGIRPEITVIELRH